MARRKFKVRKIVEILNQWQAGMSIRSISKTSGACRNTVRKYIRIAVAEGYSQGDAEPFGGWNIFFKELTPTQPNPFFKSVVFAKLLPYREQISKALATNTAKAVWQTLHDQSGVSVSKASFYRYLDHFFPISKSSLSLPMKSSQGAGCCKFCRMHILILMQARN